MGATQDLAQKVCQRYGWSAQFGTDESGFWYVEVVVGLHDKRRFVSQDHSPDSEQGRKQGIHAAATVALEGLREEIERQEAKPVKELSQVFPEEIPVYESNAENWKYFWDNRPTIVGIDTEGNQISPPVLVQVSTDDYAILEVPRRGSISYDLKRLLTDDRIAKVFCDNYSHHDKKSLGLKVPDDLTRSPIVDLEAIANKLMGPVKVARGLSRIVVLAMPELDVIIQKPKRKGSSRARLANVGRFTLIEQGKAPPMKSMYELSKKEQQYAALDAWCTLQAYKRLQESATNS